MLAKFYVVTARGNQFVNRETGAVTRTATLTVIDTETDAVFEGFVIYESDRTKLPENIDDLKNTHIQLQVKPRVVVSRDGEAQLRFSVMPGANLDPMAGLSDLK